MPTKDEMRETIVMLKAEIEGLKSMDSVEEQTIRLHWPHGVDVSQGQVPSIYGIKLTLDDGDYYADVPESRAEVELSRKGKAFVMAD